MRLLKFRKSRKNMEDGGKPRVCNNKDKIKGCLVMTPSGCHNDPLALPSGFPSPLALYRLRDDRHAKSLRRTKTSFLLGTAALARWP